jgi:hypothetical protein
MTIKPRRFPDRARGRRRPRSAGGLAVKKTSTKHDDDDDQAAEIS